MDTWIAINHQGGLHLTRLSDPSTPGPSTPVSATHPPSHVMYLKTNYKHVHVVGLANRFLKENI
ncbi:hypothetical protein YC2023_057735 [Brassica napus]